MVIFVNNVYFWIIIIWYFFEFFKEEIFFLIWESKVLLVSKNAQNNRQSIKMTNSCLKTNVELLQS